MIIQIYNQFVSRAHNYVIKSFICKLIFFPINSDFENQNNVYFLYLISSISSKRSIRDKNHHSFCFFARFSFEKATSFHWTPEWIQYQKEKRTVDFRWIILSKAIIKCLLSQSFVTCKITFSVIFLAMKLNILHNVVSTQIDLFSQSINNQLVRKSEYEITTKIKDGIWRNWNNNKF